MKKTVFLLSALMLCSILLVAQTTWTSGNDGAGSGLDADLVQGYNGSTYIGTRGQPYYQVGTWLQLGGAYGLYAPTIKDAHLIPNNITGYGQFAIYSNNPPTWGGLLLGKNSSAVHLMSNTGNYSGGFYYQDISRWQLYFDKTANYLAIGGSDRSANGSLYAGQAIFNGNVIVGKTSQTNSSYKLDVNGDIRANKIVVNTTGADYVFASTYQLISLDSLSNYIDIHHHLPGISPANEMEAQGMDVGRVYTDLLGKMEEMIRYLIKQNKMIKEQNKIISEESSKMRLLNEEVNRQQNILKKLHLADGKAIQY